MHACMLPVKFQCRQSARTAAAAQERALTHHRWAEILAPNVLSHSTAIESRMGDTAGETKQGRAGGHEAAQGPEEKLRRRSVQGQRGGGAEGRGEQGWWA